MNNRFLISIIYIMEKYDFLSNGNPNSEFTLKAKDLGPASSYSQAFLQQKLEVCKLTITYKILIALIYLQSGQDVVFNYRVNRSTTLSLYIPGLKLGFYIPESDTYKESCNYRRRVSRLMRDSDIYIAHPVSNPRYNSYWKKPKWLASQTNL